MMFQNTMHKSSTSGLGIIIYSIIFITIILYKKLEQNIKYDEMKLFYCLGIYQFTVVCNILTEKRSRFRINTAQ